ncbi:hypothetical protein POV27_15760 [Aureisphaera galaxeae]|uniref:tetratricopeptide repeat protein n=1 Tax=Aureisphaera galaxeae TaxID=1538023 RepID=UPI0023509A07|nr:hypothetical protein [Aureisphaera galaxeae]MDC8005514.1 hypothetical protein [Aureisphaera galaxeae]
MIITLRNNAKLLYKKNVFKKGADFFKPNSADYRSSETGIASEPISKAKLQEIREKIQEQNRRRRKRLALFLLIAFPISVALIYYTFKDFEFGFAGISNTKMESANLEKLKEDKFLFYLKDGDAWLKKGSYHNAIFQYTRATELFPSEYSGHYRLVLAYSYQCQYEFEGCEEGKRLLEKLEKQYPNDEGLQKTKAVFDHWGTP